jgi:pyridoxine 5-phosphate synthase
MSELVSPFFLHPRLGVNIDHVATLRQQRLESYPSLVKAAQISLDAGAEQITMHLREDRRHVQDKDIPEVFELVRKMKGKFFNFELGANPDIVRQALALRPDWICLVPEKREEKTTEGGLNLFSEQVSKNLSEVIHSFRQNAPATKISLFVEANIESLKICQQLRVDAVEIHTGDYAIDFNQNFLNDKKLKDYLQQYEKIKKWVVENTQLSLHAGHGLTDKSVRPLVENNFFEEYNIGHWIICESVFVGLAQCVRDLNDVIKSREIKNIAKG